MAMHRETAESIAQACAQMVDGMRGMLAGLEETVLEIEKAGTLPDVAELRDILDGHRVILTAIGELRAEAEVFAPAYARAGETLRTLVDASALDEN
jgi:hypothetical protein